MSEDDCDFQISAGTCVSMVFPDRPSCTRFVQDLALARGRRAIIAPGSSGGKSVLYKCDSATACPFEIRLNKCKGSDVRGYRISVARLEHRGCSGAPRPTAKQVAETAVARAAVTASPNITALALQEQIKSVSKLSVGKRMVYRVQGMVKETNMGDYATSFRQIRPLLEAFCAANPTSHFDFESDAQDQYSRAFLSNPYVAKHSTYGQDVYGIDGTFMKHGIYRETMLILVGRNGNNKNIILAVALCKSEDEDNCAWFLRNASKAGIQFEGVPVFSDRGRGLCAALERCNLGLLLRFCTRHIVGNIRSQFPGTSPADLKSVVYQIQGAETEELYRSLLAALAITHPQISAYIEKITPERWTMHPSAVRDVKMYGWRTTNFVESANGAALPVRFKFPLDVFKHYMDSVEWGGTPEMNRNSSYFYIVSTLRC